MVRRKRGFMTSVKIDRYPQVNGKSLKHFKQADNVIRFVIKKKKRCL